MNFYVKSIEQEKKRMKINTDRWKE